MNARLRSALAVSLFTSLSLTSTQAVLVSYSFDGAAGNEASFAPDAIPDHLTVSDMSRGPGINPSSSAGTFSASGWTTDPTRDPDDYFAFSLTPEEGYLLTITGFELDERRSGTGIREWAVYSSLDGFNTALGIFAVPDNTSTRTDQALPGFGPEFQDLAGPVEFRIHGYGAEGAGGTWRIDNVEVSGSVHARPVTGPPVHSVPEPAAWADLAVLLGLLALAGVRQRKLATA